MVRGRREQATTGTADTMDNKQTRKEEKHKSYLSKLRGRMRILFHGLYHVRIAAQGRTARPLAAAVQRGRGRGDVGAASAGVGRGSRSARRRSHLEQDARSRDRLWCKIWQTDTRCRTLLSKNEDVVYIGRAIVGQRARGEAESGGA